MIRRRRARRPWLARVLAVLGLGLGLASGAGVAIASEPPPAPVLLEAPPTPNEAPPEREAELADPERSDTLTLDEVLTALIHDPRLAAAERKREIAEGKQLAARGGFDTKTKVRGLVQPLSTYQNGLIDVAVSQPTPLWGLGVWAGWRVGTGDFPIYDGKLLTTRGGEVRAGVTLPLWQGGPIDRTRADIRQARAGQLEAELERDAKQLGLELEAATAYWAWVTAGLELEIERALLELAFARDAGLRRQIELGLIEEIIGTDNRRLIVARKSRVVAAERQFQAASLSLSLYLRDRAGEPVLAGFERLPLDIPEPRTPPLVDLDAEIEAALARRPDLAAGLANRQQAEVEVRFARNLLGPRIDLSGWVAKDLGPGPEELQPVELAAMVELELPIPMRKARGTLAAAKAELGRVDATLRFARNEIAVEVRDAHSAVTAAYRRARLAAEQVQLAQTMAEAQLRRFELGEGDLLLVNLRELAVADAQRERVEAVAAYFVAKAELEVALGLSVQTTSL